MTPQSNGFTNRRRDIRYRIILGFMKSSKGSEVQRNKEENELDKDKAGIYDLDQSTEERNESTMMTKESNGQRSPCPALPIFLDHA